MLNRGLIAALFFFCAVPAAGAQDRISPDAFLDQVVGKTVTFIDRVSRQRTGVEQYLRRDQSVWADETGRCTYGQIEIRGPYLCFLYEDFPEADNCWLPHILEGQLTVLSGKDWQIQIASKYSDEPVVCEGVPIS
ncbi:hypothetical protein [Roseovarius albus]|uniref:hypothetical protein n=1 Tax=Roseovarius albus TaxID=1247867 RepID=UPI00117A8490|nr:hypothetical protein [Roseovarius albus]